jgi:XTP/dITP diphosphohydrolase
LTRASPRPRLVVATANSGKLAEIRAILADQSLELLSLAELEPVELPEEGGDYETNAIAKARSVAEQLGLPAIADDSGLEVDALHGRPGVYSARYGGSGLSDTQRVELLLAELAAAGQVERTARFVCVAALATPGGGVVTRRGECAGRILETPRGRAGFGYDPVFQPRGHSESMAELPSAEKDRLSHRGRAFEALADSIRRCVTA